MIICLIVKFEIYNWFFKLTSVLLNNKITNQNMESQYYLTNECIDFDESYQPAYDDILKPPGAKLDLLQFAK